MISLKNYMRRNGEDIATYRHVIELLIHGIAVHAVPGEKGDYDRFKSDIEQLASSLNEETKPSELLVTVETVVHTLADYTRATFGFITRQSTEFQNMVSMLTQTVMKIGTNSDTSVNKLRDIERGLVNARMTDDIQVLKTRLGETLEAVRQEAERQKTESQATMTKLEGELDGSRQRMGTVAQTKEADAVTGLLCKKEAEKALRSAVGWPDDKFVLIVVVNRVNAVNARFGYAVGDRILANCAKHLRSGLAASDELFRWQGPAFLAILSRSRRVDEVRSEVRHFADLTFEQNIEVSTRNVLIPVSTNWSVIQVIPPLESLHKKIEAFTAAQVPRGEYA